MQGRITFLLKQGLNQGPMRLATENVNLIGLACGIDATNPDCAYGPEALNPELNHYQITAKIAIEIFIEGLVKV